MPTSRRNLCRKDWATCAGKAEETGEKEREREKRDQRKRERMKREKEREKERERKLFALFYRLRFSKLVTLAQVWSQLDSQL